MLLNEVRSLLSFWDDELKAYMLYASPAKQALVEITIRALTDYYRMLEAEQRIKQPLDSQGTGPSG